MAAKLFGASDAWNQTAANEATDFDAVVISGITPNGNKYATVDAALAAGAKNILIHAGEYAGFTLSQTYVRIVAASWNNYYAGAYSNDGVWFNSTITVSGGANILDGLAVTTSSGTGFQISGDRNVLINCRADGCAVIGANLAGGRTRIYGGVYCTNVSHGIYAGGECYILNARCSLNSGPEADGIHLGAQSFDAYIGFCEIKDNGNHGVDTETTGGDEVLIGNIITGNTTANTDGTFSLGVDEGLNITT